MYEFSLPQLSLFNHHLEKLSSQITLQFLRHRSHSPWVRPILSSSHISIIKCTTRYSYNRIPERFHISIKLSLNRTRASHLLLDVIECNNLVSTRIQVLWFTNLTVLRDEDLQMHIITFMIFVTARKILLMKWITHTWCLLLGDWTWSICSVLYSRNVSGAALFNNDSLGINARTSYEETLYHWQTLNQTQPSKVCERRKRIPVTTSMNSPGGAFNKKLVAICTSSSSVTSPILQTTKSSPLSALCTTRWLGDDTHKKMIDATPNFFAAISACIFGGNFEIRISQNFEFFCGQIGLLSIFDPHGAKSEQTARTDSQHDNNSSPPLHTPCNYCSLLIPGVGGVGDDVLALISSYPWFLEGCLHRKGVQGRLQLANVSQEHFQVLRIDSYWWRWSLIMNRAHNETVNVWTHFIGFLIFAGLMFHAVYPI